MYSRPNQCSPPSQHNICCVAARYVREGRIEAERKAIPIVKGIYVSFDKSV